MLRPRMSYNPTMPQPCLGLAMGTVGPDLDPNPRGDIPAWPQSIPVPTEVPVAQGSDDWKCYGNSSSWFFFWENTLPRPLTVVTSVLGVEGR